MEWRYSDSVLGLDTVRVILVGLINGLVSITCEIYKWNNNWQIHRLQKIYPIQTKATELRVVWN